MHKFDFERNLKFGGELLERSGRWLSLGQIWENKLELRIVL